MIWVDLWKEKREGVVGEMRKPCMGLSWWRREKGLRGLVSCGILTG